MDQARTTEAAKTQYNNSVQQNAPVNVQKNLHDTMVWEETKFHALGLATTEAANNVRAAQQKAAEEKKAVEQNKTKKK